MLVFVLLGVTIFEEGLRYDFFLIAMTCIGTVLARGLGTGILSFLLNLRRPASDRISLKSQIIIWNAGLRGAVAYALAVSSTMPRDNVENTNLMITTVHASVLFTIFFHGLLTVPLVAWTGLAGAGADSRQLSEPRPARKKIHGLWSRIDKTWIIPFISFARPSPGDVADQPRLDDHGLELDERDSSIDIPRGRVSYDGYDENPNGLDHSLFDKNAPKGPALRASASALNQSSSKSASGSSTPDVASASASANTGEKKSPSTLSASSHIKRSNSSDDSDVGIPMRNSAEIHDDDDDADDTMISLDMDDSGLSRSRGGRD